MIKNLVLGGGCFWCTEAVFSIIKGVTSTQPGFSGGNVENPSYERVCEGNTGHAEVVDVKYDDSVISLTGVLDIFFSMHDPTSVDRQGDDIGEQYRSAIFFTETDQKDVIEDYIRKAQTKYPKKIVTEVSMLKHFYPAEEYHKDYFKRNPTKSYCNYVIRPKVEKILYVSPELVVRI